LTSKLLIALAFFRLYHVLRPGPTAMDAIAILYEDNDVVAVNKPEGLVSNARGGQEGLAPQLAAAGAGRLYIVHRLDKEVSGVLLLAKNAEAHKFLNDLFSRGEIRKTYVAVALGQISQSRGVIDKPIREFGSSRMGVDPERGKPSRTEFEVTERLKDSTLVKVRPFSGRRHQIRVHFYSIGHPLAGDLKYGDRSVQRAYPRLMLHALDISFKRRGGEEVKMEAPVPESFREVLEELRHHSRTKPQP
jgi:tRNA pseudouridine32 synthase/23S rRNA pseudouridine746 synthase